MVARIDERWREKGGEKRGGGGSPTKAVQGEVAWRWGKDGVKLEGSSRPPVWWL
jgi:hypothetical protein